MLEIRLHRIARLSICVFLFYMMWFKYVYGERSVILYGSSILAAGCMVLDLMLSRRDVFAIFPKGVLLNLVMCVYSLAAGFWIVKNQELLLSSVKTYVAFSLVCIAICYVTREEGGIGWLLNVLILVCIVESFYVLTRGYHWPTYGYVLSPDHNPNSLGLDMDIGLFCLAYKSKTSYKRTIGYLAVAVLFLYVIVGCGSRKCLIAGAMLCAMWLYPLFLNFWKEGGVFIRVLLAFAAAAVLFSIIYYFRNVYISSDSYKRMLDLGDSKEYSSGNRKLMYRYALEYFKESPFFGIGLDQFSVRSPFHTYSHSTYAEAIASWGAVGCLIYFIPSLGAGLQALRMSFGQADTFIPRILFAFWIMEMFLGIGQIWFYEVDHLIAWTMIFLCLDDLSKAEPCFRRQYKYVKA